MPHCTLYPRTSKTLLYHNWSLCCCWSRDRSSGACKKWGQYLKLKAWVVFVKIYWIRCALRQYTALELLLKFGNFYKNLQLYSLFVICLSSRQLLKICMYINLWHNYIYVNVLWSYNISYRCCVVTLCTGRLLANTSPHQLHQHGQEIGTGNLVDKMHASNKMSIKFLLMEGNEYKCWCQCLT